MLKNIKMNEQINDEKQFDCIISLGGNCCAALQLKQRNLRKTAMPFDWFLIETEKDLEKYTEAFKNEFSGCYTHKTLEDTSEQHKSIAYYDKISGQTTYHAFKKPITDKKEYKRVHTQISRRLKRLFSLKNKGLKLCFIMTLGFEPQNKETLFKLKDIIFEKFGSECEIIYILFNSKNNSIENFDSMVIYNLTRAHDNYDLFKTCRDWAFLDNFSVNNKLKLNSFKITDLIELKSLKRGGLALAS